MKDVIADNFLQQVLLRPEEYDVIATLNLNGDYVSDALAAQVGGIGIAPGGNIGDGLAVFEATHGTAPGFAGKDRVNPGSLILSAEMMLRYMKWREAADLIIKGVTRTIAHKELTYDLARLREAIKAPKRELAARKNVEEDLQRLIPGAKLMSTSGFAGAVIRHMDDLKPASPSRRAARTIRAVPAARGWRVSSRRPAPAIRLTGHARCPPSGPRGRGS